MSWKKIIIFDVKNTLDGPQDTKKTLYSFTLKMGNSPTLYFEEVLTSSIITLLTILYYNCKDRQLAMLDVADQEYPSTEILVTALKSIFVFVFLI